MSDKLDIAAAVSKSSGQNPGLVANAFDGIAGLFDTTLENEITTGIRENIYSVVGNLVSPGCSILDVNCGTGIDLLHFLKEGYRATGIDISQGMIEAARKKLNRAQREDVVLTVSSYESLGSSRFAEFDLVFSNFGGLNCTPNLDRAAKAISSVTKPGGYFVGVIMPPFSLWETATFASRLQWNNAVRRFHESTPATGFSGNVFPVYYYSPSATAKAFAPDFVTKKITGISIFSPNPQSTHFVSRHPLVSKFLAAFDRLVENIPLIRSVGDHYIIVLRKRK